MMNMILLRKNMRKIDDNTFILKGNLNIYEVEKY